MMERKQDQAVEDEKLLATKRILSSRYKGPHKWRIDTLLKKVCPGHDASPEPSPAQFFRFPTSHWSAAVMPARLQLRKCAARGCISQLRKKLPAGKSTLAPSYSGRPPQIPFTLG